MGWDGGREMEREERGYSPILQFLVPPLTPIPLARLVSYCDL